MLPARIIEGTASDMLLIADHASRHVPETIDLGIAPELLDRHIAVDIGVEQLADALCAQLGCPAVLGGVSRLVIDYNREIGALGLIPEASDGEVIAGNRSLGRAEREERLALWHSYHASIRQKISTIQPKMLISLHSFTPRLTGAMEDRPWEIGVLYNRDERAARIAIPLLEARKINTGDNLPYSGKVLNATMDQHGEANGIAYLGLEVRQDLIGHAEGVAEWAGILAPIIAETAESLA